MIFIRILGDIEYHYALIMMKKTLRMRIEKKIKDHIYLLEHKPVITIGKNGNLTNILTYTMHIPIFLVKRGGDVTLHSPGQLIVYPIIKLDERGMSLRDMISMLEYSVIKVLELHGLKGYWKKGTAGVWVNNKKIASIGLAVNHWTTYHGLAFNINNDLTLFQYIRPCGLPSDEMTNLENEIGEDIDFEKIVEEYIRVLSSLVKESVEIRQIQSSEIINFLYEEPF